MDVLVIVGIVEEQAVVVVIMEVDAAEKEENKTMPVKCKRCSRR